MIYPRTKDSLSNNNSKKNILANNRVSKIHMEQLENDKMKHHWGEEKKS